MLTLPNLKKMHAGLQSDADSAAAKAAALDAAIQKIKADGSRHPTWIAEKIAEARAAALPAIAAIVRTFDERLKLMEAQKRFWESKPFVLSLQKFDASNPANDAVIAARYLGELSMTSAAVLQLTADSAKEDNNFPLLWHCALAGQQRAGEPGWTGISLDDVEIPDQKTALDLIAAAKSLTWLAHSTYSVASGNVLTGVERLALARSQQAAA